MKMSSPALVRQTLAKYRDEPAVGLDFTFPISWQMDEEACQAISRELAAHAGKWERFRAVSDLHKSLPAKPGVYMFSFHSKISLNIADEGQFVPSWILYVGRAGSQESERTLQERYRSEYSKLVGGNVEELWVGPHPKGRHEILRKYLRIYPLYYWYCVIEDRNKIEHLEKRLIKYLSPPLNTIGRPRVRVIDTKPAFKRY